ncbi:MAG: extracellular solute-binding protein [Elusimicrobia bacterium]|nr:extracellular solute-binding protein [Elusimicrobiota bacterium]
MTLSNLFSILLPPKAGLSFCRAVVLLFMACNCQAIELLYWPSSNTEEIKLAEILVSEWNELHPDIYVKMQPIPATQSSEEVLLSAIVSKTTPDICSNILPAIMGRFVKSKAVISLDRFKDGEKVIVGRTGAKLADRFRSKDGKLYQIPWKSNPVMLAYNKEIFKSLKLEPPKTYSEFMHVAKSINSDENGDGISDHWAMAVSIKTIWYQRLFDFYPFYAAATGGKTLLKDDKAIFNNNEAVAVMKFFGEGFEKQYFPMLGFSGNIFVDGKTAMSIVGPWVIKYYQRLNPDFKFDFAPIPVPDNHKGHVYTYGDPKNIVIFSTTKYPDEAWEFIKFLISKKADLKLLEITNQIPTRANVANDMYFKSFFKKNPLLRKVARQADYVVPMDESSHLVQIMDIISSQFEAAAVYRVITPEESIKQAAEKVQNIYDYW